MQAPRSVRAMEAVEGWLRARLSAGGLRVAYRLGYLALRPVWLVTRPRTRGVKAVVRRGDRVLLVRHTYARRGQWDLPGGFLRPGEDAAAGLRRELAEELRVTPATIRQISVEPTRHERKRERLFGFVVDVADGVVHPSAAEIADARWFEARHLPDGTNRYARRLVARAGWELWRE